LTLPDLAALRCLKKGREVQKGISTVSNTSSRRDSHTRLPKGSLDILSYVSDASRQEFMDASHLRRFAKGQLIYCQGDLTQEMYRIVSGTVRISHIASDGRELVILHYEKGDCFAFSSLIDEGGVLHTAEAISDVEVQAVPAAAFNALREHRDVDRALIVLLSRYMRLLSDYTTEASLDELGSRLARRLLTLARPDAQGLLAVHLPQLELAAMLGATRQSVNKELKQFEDEGLIVLSYGIVVLRDPEKLRVHAR